MHQTPKEYREQLVDQIKEMAKDLNELAEDLVGNTDMISEFEIVLKFGHYRAPTIVVLREHIAKHARQYLLNTPKKG